MNDRQRGAPVATTEDADAEDTEAAKRNSELALVVAYSPDPGPVAAITLGDRVVVVGRDVRGAGVSIDDERMSRVHFRLAFDHRARSHRVGDAQSRNGTFVDGARVESAVLRRGNVIRAGESVFVYGEPDPLKAAREVVA